MAEPIVKICTVPRQNPIRWVKEDSPNADAKTLRPDNFFVFQNYFYDLKANYYQKRTFDDWNVTQIFIGGTYTNQNRDQRENDHMLQILDSKGVIVAEFKWITRGNISGNVKEEGGVVYNLTTLNFAFNFRQYVAKPGIYLLRIKLAYPVIDHTEYDYWCSEPIDVREKHPRTLSLAWSSDVNKLGTHYRTPNVFFYGRIECKILVDSLANELTQYDDQQMRPQQQDAIPYRRCVMKMGYQNGLPMYLLEMVNHWASNDRFYVEGVRYKRDTDAQVIIGNKIPNYARYGGALVVREADESEAETTTSKIPILIYTPTYVGNAMQPYCARNITLTNTTSGNKVTIFVGYEVNNLTQEDAWIGTLNFFANNVHGLSGKFSRRNRGIIWTNGAGEYYDSGADSYILRQRFWMSYILNPNLNVNQTIYLGLRMNASICAIVPKYNYEVYCYGGDNPATYALITAPAYNFGFDTTALVSIWHNHTIDEIYVNNSYDFDNVQAGVMPLNIRVLSFNTTRMTYFSLAPVNTTLQYLQIAYSPITDLDGLAIKNWASLNMILIHHDKFPVAVVDRIFNDRVASTPVLPAGGQFINKFNTPLAAPTGASAVARAAIAAAGTLVLTD